MTTHRLPTGLIFILLGLTTLSLQGCLAGLSISTSNTIVSAEMENLFTSGTLLPDHTYYSQGHSDSPEAIIAIHNDFQLQSNLWSRRDWSQEEFKDIIFWMGTDEMGTCFNRGGPLIAPDGRQFGMWYSKKDITVIRQPSPNVVVIYPFEAINGSSCRRQEWLDEL
ncbi:MAG: hypothetical protein ABFS19_14030 [Thermodesulfobacteriota bacterium]